MARCRALVALATLGSCAVAVPTVAELGKEEHKLSLDEYIHALKALDAQDHPEDEVADVRGHTIRYLERVSKSVTRTVVEEDHRFAADCVPFLMQPALLDASDSDKETAAQLHREVIAARGGKEGADAEGAVCPGESIPVPRYRLKHFVGKKRNVFHKVGRPSPHHHSGLESSSGYAGPQGYTYDVSDTNPTNGATNVSVTLEVGTENVPMPYTPSGSGHVLNQMWFTGNSNSQSLITLESGWIQCDYFTGNTALSVFAFSTPDSYQNQCGNADQYNYNGGFVQYSGATSVGYPLNSFTGTLQWETSAGYGNTLYLDQSPLGYYPTSHYCNGIGGFSGFQSGLEVAVGESTGFVVSGSVLSWSIGGEDQTVNGQFQSSPAAEGWNSAYQPYENGLDSVQFSGQYVPLQCITDLNVQCVADVADTILV